MAGKSKGSWRGLPPNACQILGPGCKGITETFVDGATRGGPWAIMCITCHRTHGVGLGTGKGQMYDAATLDKIEG